MAILTAEQLRLLFNIKTGAESENFWVSKSYQGLTPITRDREIGEAACWNWVFYGAVTANIIERTHPEYTYKNLTPVDFDSYGTQIDRAVESISVPTMNANQNKILRTLWSAANNPSATDEDIQNFVQFMMRHTAKINGLEPSESETNYTLAMTVPRKNWHHWQHWAIGIRQGITRYLQTAPAVTLHWGDNEVWESERDGHILSEIYLKGLLPAHVELIELILLIPTCRSCKKLKPKKTIPEKKWSTCSKGHIFCGVCQPQKTKGDRYHPVGNLCRFVHCHEKTTELSDDYRY
ncbi:hypothetical protein R0G64_19940 [Pseudomonas otitidis]|uniref:Uncharacterized protein n=1 Tax=Metapseudomonas otitidis TaxID=319939 RepID=A0ABU3XUT5_9GAMM|nr:hypothetical protein [Pseudomonas otitidis]MDV3441694.1 hypothetical protein [Pseudomonas otitidis]